MYGQDGYGAGGYGQHASASESGVIHSGGQTLTTGATQHRSMSGVTRVYGSHAEDAETDTAGETVAVELGEQDARTRMDILVETSGAATLSISVSRTGEFTGEEATVQTVDYDGAVTQLEQFDFAYPFVAVEVDQNLTRLAPVSRGV